MNTQEREQINQLLKPLVEFKLTAKDSEADQLIREAVTRQPDAAYLLVQRVLLLEHALNNAKARIDDLQRQVASQAASSSSFLGNDPWAQAASSAPVPGATNYQAQPRYAAAPPMAAAQQAPQSGGLFGGGSSFLGNVATTAAGVVAGSFLFQGIENLMGHHGGGFGGGGFGQPGFGESGFGGEHISEQTVINNYYGDDASANQSADASYSGSSDNNYQSVSDDSDFFSDSGDSGDSDWI